MSSPRLRPARVDDREPLLDLKCQVFSALSRAAEERRHTWQFDQNPSFSDALPRAMVWEERDRLIASYSFVPVRVQIGAHVGIGAAGIDLAVARSARGRGLARPLTAVHWAEGFCDFPHATGLNEASAHLFSSHGGTLLGGERETTVHAHFANQLPQATGEAPVTGEAEEPAVGDFEDELWGCIASSSILSLVKDASYLRWRYERFPFERCEFLRVRRESGEPAGLAVLQADPNHGRAYLLELLIAPGEELRIGDLLEMAVHRAGLRKLGSVFVCTRNLEHAAQLERSAWTPVPGNTPTFIGKLHGALARIDVSSWQTALGDGDQLYQVGAPS